MAGNTKKKYILCSRMCSENEYTRIIIDDQFKIGQSIQKYYRVFCEGFVLNNLYIKAFSVRPVGRKESGRLYLSSKDEIQKGVHFHYTKSVHIAGLDYLFSFFNSFFWFLFPNHCNKNDRVIIDPLCLLPGLGCFIACKLRGIKTVAYVTDLPFVYVSSDSMPSIVKRLSYWLQTHADGNIFLTEQMSQFSNPKHRPYIIVEGFVDKGMVARNNTLEEKHKKKVVLYSGCMKSIYGLDILVEGFLKANVDNSELHLYGDGDYVPVIEELVKKDSRIKFFGCRNNSEVVEAQLKATLLVNPRYTDQEYTKYSFPGKNLEYMVSGTATLTTVLPGMPKAYYHYVYLLTDETVEGMAKAIREILNKRPDEIHEFGLCAKKWMLANKSNQRQVARIAEFLDKL